MFAAAARSESEKQTILMAGGKGNGAAIGRITIGHHGEGERLASAASAWQPLSAAGWIMSIIPADMDGDGDEDVLYSDRRGALRGVRWLENPLPERARRARGRTISWGVRGAK